MSPARARKATDAAASGLDAVARALMQALAAWHDRHPSSTEGRTLGELGRSMAARGEARPPDDLLKQAARRLAEAGLVQVQRASAKAKERLRLTDAGLAVVHQLEEEAADAERPSQRGKARAARGRGAGMSATAIEERLRAWERRASGLEERVASVEAALRSVTERLTRLEQRFAAAVAGAEAAAPAGTRPGETGDRQPAGAPAPKVTLEAFRDKLLAAIERLDRELRQFGLVPVPRVRQVLAEVAAGADFDRLTLELAARREVQLVPHDHPASLSPEERAASIRDPWLGQLYYWFRRGV